MLCVSTASDYLLSIGFNDLFTHNLEYADMSSSDYDYDILELHSQTWGAVSVLYDGISGRICYDGWDDQDADVACREMGFMHGQAYNHYSGFKAEYRTNTVWSSNFNCT